MVIGLLPRRTSRFFLWNNSLGNGFTPENRVVAAHNAMVWLVSLVVLASALQNRASAFDEALIEEFRAKAPEAWKTYEAKGFIFRAESTMTTTESDDRPPLRRKTIFKEQVGHRLIEEVPFDDNPKTVISAYAFNPDYYFTVQKRQSSKDWLLTNLMIRHAKDNQITGDYDYTVKMGLHQIVFQVGPDRLPELFQEKNFKVLNAQPIALGNDSCVKIEFDNTHSLKETSATHIQSGWFVVDPNQCWCVRDYQVKTLHSNAKGVHSTEKLELRPSRFPGLPLPVEIIRVAKTVATEAEFAGTESVRRTVGTYRIDDTSFVPLAEFRLPAYGLPEPEGFGQTLLWYHYLGISILAAAVIVVYLIYRKKNQIA